jgi:hypothetical protein
LQKKVKKPKNDKKFQWRHNAHTMNAPQSADAPSDEKPAENLAGLPEPALATEAIAQVLQPLARLMIDHGLQLPTMVELLKKALVTEAVGTYGLAGRGSSDMRIALLTGVHRKDVKRLRDESVAATPTTPMVPLAASVVARWISEPRYLHADRSTRALARTPGKSLPGEPDFTSLVAEVSRDVGARAVLDELLRLGVVDVDEDGHVQLKTKSFVPQSGQGDAFHFLATNVSDHLSTAVHNLKPGRTAPPMLEQSAFSQDLTPHQADQLQALARQLWSDALQRFLQSATVAEERSQGSPTLKQRIRFGVYCHQQPQNESVHIPDQSDKSPSKKRPRKTPT